MRIVEAGNRPAWVGGAVILLRNGLGFLPIRNFQCGELVSYLKNGTFKILAALVISTRLNMTFFLHRQDKKPDVR